MNDLLVLESGNGAVTNIKKALSRLTEHHKKLVKVKKQLNLLNLLKQRKNGKKWIM